MVLMTLDSGVPLYVQIARKLRREIHDGRLAVGDKVPASRALAANLGVSRNTVLNALEQLKAEGYFETRHGAGTFVAAGYVAGTPVVESRAEKPATALVRLSDYARRLEAMRFSGSDEPSETVFDFSYGRNRPDGTPLDKWLHCRGAAIHSSVDYADASGVQSLRREIARYLYRRRGLHVSAENIIVTSGTQQSLDLLARVVLDPGDKVTMEDPHYESARLVFQTAGASLETVSVDDDGLVSEDLPAASDSKILYVTPSHQFPTGSILTVRRRIEILDWARRNSVLVIEDDYDSEFRYDVRPLQPMIALDGGGSVAYCGTFSKSLLPGLRLAYMVAPDALVAPLKMAKLLADRGSNKIAQHHLEMLLSSGRYGRHVHRVTQRYKLARQRLIAGLKHHFGGDVQVGGTNAGAHLLVSFGNIPVSNTERLLAAAASEGLAIYSALHCYYALPPPHVVLLFGYSAIDPDRIPAAISRLAHAYEAVRATL